jgi:hypothetical protein
VQLAAVGEVDPKVHLLAQPEVQVVVNPEALLEALAQEMLEVILL